MIEDRDFDEVIESVRPLMFKYGYLLPILWKRKGAKLKYAADQLFELSHKSATRFLEQCSKKDWSTMEAELSKEVNDISLMTEYCLLMGYAIENLLKGILMAKHPEYFKPDAKIKEICSHDLVSLCKRCVLQITADEEKLLRKLTDHIEWVGKYPVPLHISATYPKRSHDGKWEGKEVDQLNGHTTKEMVESLYTRFLDELSSHEEIES